jgi:hypothetical protein
MRNFTATVKERDVGQPCFVVFEPAEAIGLPADRQVVLDMPEGSGLEEARAVARLLNDQVAAIRLK